MLSALQRAREALPLGSDSGNGFAAFESPPVTLCYTKCSTKVVETKMMHDAAVSKGVVVLHVDQEMQSLAISGTMS